MPTYFSRTPQTDENLPKTGMAKLTGAFLQHFVKKSFKIRMSQQT
jgi:hypothetical protein